MARNPNAPKFLRTDAARNEWRRIYMANPRLDPAAAETYIRAYDRHSDIAAELDEILADNGGYVVMTQTGDLKLSPLLDAEMRARAQLMQAQRSANVWSNEDAPTATGPTLLPPLRAPAA